VGRLNGSEIGKPLRGEQRVVHACPRIREPLL